MSIKSDAKAKQEEHERLIKKMELKYGRKWNGVNVSSMILLKKGADDNIVTEFSKLIGYLVLTREHKTGAWLGCGVSQFPIDEDKVTEFFEKNKESLKEYGFYLTYLGEPDFEIASENMQRLKAKNTCQ